MTSTNIMHRASSTENHVEEIEDYFFRNFLEASFWSWIADIARVNYPMNLLTFCSITLLIVLKFLSDIFSPIFLRAILDN